MTPAFFAVRNAPVALETAFSAGPTPRHDSYRAKLWSSARLAVLQLTASRAVVLFKALMIGKESCTWKLPLFANRLPDQPNALIMSGGDAPNYLPGNLVRVAPHISASPALLLFMGGVIETHLISLIYHIRPSAVVLLNVNHPRPKLILCSCRSRYRITRWWTERMNWNHLTLVINMYLNSDLAYSQGFIRVFASIFLSKSGMCVV